MTAANTKRNPSKKATDRKRKAAHAKAGRTISRKAKARKARPKPLAVPEVLRSITTPIPVSTETCQRSFVAEDLGVMANGGTYVCYAAKVRTSLNTPCVDRVAVFVQTEGKVHHAYAKFYPSITLSDEVFGCVGAVIESTSISKAVKAAVQSAANA